MNLNMIAILALGLAVTTSSGSAQTPPPTPKAAPKSAPSTPPGPDSPQKAVKKAQAAAKKKELKSKQIVEKAKADEADAELQKAASSLMGVLSKHEKALKPLLAAAPKVAKKSPTDVAPEVATAVYIDSPAFDPKATLKPTPEVAQVVKTAAVKVKASNSKKDKATTALAGLEALEKDDRLVFEAEFGAGAWDVLVP